MAKKNKLWFSGEDAQLAARFTKCLTKALYNRRASYLRAKAEQAASEISIHLPLLVFLYSVQFGNRPFVVLH